MGRASWFPSPCPAPPGVLKKAGQWELHVQERRNLRGDVCVSGRRPFPGTLPPLAPPRPPRPRPRRRGPGAPRSLGPAAAGTREGKAGPPGPSSRSSGRERPPYRVRGPGRREEPGSGTARGQAGRGRDWHSRGGGRAGQGRSGGKDWREDADTSALCLSGV